MKDPGRVNTITTVKNFSETGLRVTSNKIVPQVIVTAITAMIFLFPVSIIPADAWAESPSAHYMESDLDNYMKIEWNTGSGLPHNSVRAITKTCDGYIWVGTPSGLARFDGAQFKVLNGWKTKNLPGNRISSLYQDRDGVLWVGTSGGGLYRYSYGQWRKSERGREFANNHIRAIAGEPNGDLWVGTEYGLYCLKDQEVIHYGFKDGLPDNFITALTTGRYGTLWAGTMHNGLARFQDVLVQNYDFDDGLKCLTVLSLAADREGRIWIGTMESLFHLEPEEGLVNPVKKITDTPVTALTDLSGDGLLVGTMTEGLKYLSDHSCQDLFPHSELDNSNINTIYRDDQGYIWAGTENRGLVMIKSRRVSSITSRDGLPAGAVYTILEEDRNTVWVGTGNSGLFRMRGRNINKALNRSNGLAGNMIRCLMKDGAGRLWIGTRDGGMSIITNEEIKNITSREGLPSDNVTVIFQDKMGKIWIGTDMGLTLNSIGKSGFIEKASFLDKHTIRTIFEDSRGTIYAGTGRGLYKQAGNAFEIIKTGENLFDVLTIHQDSSGGFWLGTNGSGLVYLVQQPGHPRHQKTTNLTKNEGLPGNCIYSVIEEAGGILWVSSESGVFTISRDSLVAYLENNTDILTPALYDHYDGMPSSRCAGPGRPSVCKLSNGAKLYPTINGIAVFDTALLSSTESGEPYFSISDSANTPHPPLPHIESVITPDSFLSSESNIELSDKTDLLEINFTAFDYSGPGKCRFIYLLEGYDTSPTIIHPGEERKALYRDLPPGEYRFTLQAIGNGGLQSERAATVNFTIIPSFYRTATFALIATGVLLFVLASVATSLRFRKIRRQRNKYSTTTMDEERMEKALRELNTLMEEEKAFLDPDLTLKKLAQQLRIHYNQLSRIINEKFKLSFNDYINKYRIREAQKKLTDPAETNKNILEIMYDAGFYSKSTFNTAFKKFTGTTPSKYRQSHRQIPPAKR